MTEAAKICAKMLILLAFFCGCDDDDEPDQAQTAAASASQTPASAPVAVASAATPPDSSPPALTSGQVDELPLPDMPDPPPPPTARPDASGPEANLKIFDGYGFPVYSPLEHLCGRREIRPGGGNLTWDAFTSGDPPAALVQHYKQRLSERGFTSDGDGGAWLLPPGSAAPDRKLSIYRASHPGLHTACDKQPGPQARSIILISRER